MFEIFADHRGTIEIISKNSDVLRIRTARGYQRASHFHKLFGHRSLVVFGGIAYFERPVGQNIRPTCKEYIAGEMFWTAPMMEHLMVFDKFDVNEFFCFSAGNRNQLEYETDLIRISHDLKEIYDNWKY